MTYSLFSRIGSVRWLMLAPALVLLSSCGQGGIQVETAEVTQRDILSRVTESGTITPTVQVPIAPDVAGEVVNIAVREGAKVKKGDLLITILPDDYRAQLEQATASLNRSQAAYSQAKANQSQARAQLMQDSVSLARTKELFAEGVVSQVDLENAQLAFNVSRSQYESAKYNVEASYYQVKSSEATRQQARQTLDRTNIYASMDGTITAMNVELGQRVVGTSMMAGTEILTIADLSSMEVVCEVNENDIINVKLQDSARIEVDAIPGRVFSGKVSEIAYSASSSGMATTDQVTNFEVKVRIDPESYAELAPSPGESPFRPGMTALVEVFTQEAEGAIAVPMQAVTLRGAEPGMSATAGREVVYRYQNGTVEEVTVQTGISDDRYLEVTEGLQPGDLVVTGPYQVLTQVLKDGMEVSEEQAEGATARAAGN